MYYCRVGTGHIKIGKSVNARARVGSFYAELLATEPGYTKKERDRHRQFSKERVRGTELFERSERLLSHIERLKKKEAS